jgi:citrate synthase
MSDVADWWQTGIIDMEPGRIDIRGRPIADLIGNLSFPQMIWLMLRGDIPNDGQAKLLEAALVAAVDHGPQAPSIATARMAMTCGIGLQSAMASAINTLGDVHGGAGEQAVELYRLIDLAGSDGLTALNDWRAENGTYVSGFGHRFHTPTDPRAPRLMQLVKEAATMGTVSGKFADIALWIEGRLALERGKPVPMNIDGATAVIYAELGFDAGLARGLFVLSRSVGILAHAWEQKQQGGRNKGPTPPGYRWTYAP